MTIRPSGVQFDLKSYEWLTKSEVAKRESDLSITSMITTELDDMKSCYQLIITVTIPRKKIHLGQISLERTTSKAKNLKISQFSFRGKWLLPWLLWSILWLVDLAEWTQYNWLLQLSDHRWLQPIVRLQLCRVISEI